MACPVAACEDFELLWGGGEEGLGFTMTAGGFGKGLPLPGGRKLPLGEGELPENERSLRLPEAESKEETKGLGSQNTSASEVGDGEHGNSHFHLYFSLFQHLEMAVKMTTRR